MIEFGNFVPLFYAACFGYQEFGLDFRQFTVNLTLVSSVDGLLRVRSHR